jgi:serine/threonine protein kinase
MVLVSQVFQALGTPSEDVLREFADLKSGDVSIPPYPPMDSKKLFRTSDPLLINLVERLLAFDPRRRITARDAIHHPYFDALSPALKKQCHPQI